MVESFLIAGMLILLTSDILEMNVLRAIRYYLIGTLFYGLLAVYFPLHGLITFSNDVQKEVKKMILEDVKKKVQLLPD